MQTVLVTGASAGFGAAIARRFAAADYHVIAAARRLEKLTELPGAQVLPLDVTDRAAVTAALSDLEVDILVANAGLALGMQPAAKADLDDWDTMVQTNCAGLMYCVRAVLPGMVVRGRGHVLTMGSIAGTYSYPGGNVYGATKAFVDRFAMNLRADLAGSGVRVTNIEPGLVGGTEFSKVRFHGDDAKAAAVYAGTVPLTADDVCEAVYWAATQPAHVNINRIELMPVCQSFGPLPIHRD